MIQLRGILDTVTYFVAGGKRIMNKILVVEDDEAIANLLYMNLKKAGYHCKIAYDGKEGADMLAEEKFDLGIFDIMVPELDGYELLQYASMLAVPVIFLTAKDTTMDKVKGLRTGAEDYITKPFEILELLARIENVFKRYHKTKTHYVIKDLEIDVASREVKKNGKQIELTCKEFDLLLLFIKNPNIALYRSVIYEKVWESEYMGESRTVDLHVQRLRKKTGLVKEIASVYKIGYRFTLQ